MRKKQGLARVSSVEIPEALADFNDANNVTRARLVFTFGSDEPVGGNDITANLVARTGNQTYSVIIDITDMGQNETAALKTAKAAFEGKTATFTVFTWDVSELNENGETVVNNGSREYSALSDPYVGTAATEESSLTRMVSRLARDIENGNLEFGSLTSEPNSRGGNLRNSNRR